MKKIYFLLSIILFAKAHEQIISQLNFAIANNNSDQFAKLLSLKANINLCTRDITPPLFNAIFFGNYEFTKMLLDHGANVNLQDHCGSTPLHCALNAIAGDKEKIIKLLLQHGADSKIKDNYGKTPTDYNANLAKQIAKLKMSKLD